MTLPPSALALTCKHAFEVFSQNETLKLTEENARLKKEIAQLTEQLSAFIPKTTYYIPDEKYRSIICVHLKEIQDYVHTHICPLTFQEVIQESFWHTTPLSFTSFYLKLQSHLLAISQASSWSHRQAMQGSFFLHRMVSIIIAINPNILLSDNHLHWAATTISTSIAAWFREVCHDLLCPTPPYPSSPAPPDPSSPVSS
jgi:hypothetical protein